MAGIVPYYPSLTLVLIAAQVSFACGIHRRSVFAEVLACVTWNPMSLQTLATKDEAPGAWTTYRRLFCGADASGANSRGRVTRSS